MTPQHTFDQSVKQRFEEATRSMEFNTIDEIVAQLDAHGFFDEGDAAKALDTYKKSYARHMLRAATKNGIKMFRSIVTPDESGKQVRKYKQEALFNLDDYRQTIGYHRQQFLHHLDEAMGLQQRAKDRFGIVVQFELPFPPIKAA